VNDESEFRGFPPPSNPLPPSQPKPRIRRSPIIVSGLVFGFLPILIPLVASSFIDDALNEGSSTLGVLPWLTFFTLPVGGVIMLVGAVKPNVARILLLTAGAVFVLSLMNSLPVVAVVLLALGIVVYKKT
jgi:hypothetical protein